jgi:hypothetical protein
MLGRLARWLRVLGLDVLYDASATDAAIVARAAADGRVLLTRDGRLIRELRPERSLAVRSEVPLEQLAQVLDELRILPPAELFTRCLLCNEPLADVPLAERADLVPPSARALPGPVRRCPRCGRVYWPGSHARRMRRAIERALPGWLP